jgi:hypothetical protein
MIPGSRLCFHRKNRLSSALATLKDPAGERDFCDLVLGSASLESRWRFALEDHKNQATLIDARRDN